MYQFEPPSDEQMNGLREKHGDDLLEVEDNGRVFVFAKPEKPRGYVDRFVSTAGNERKRLEACEALVKGTCVYPDKETLKRVFEDEPGMAMSLVEPATELLGIRQLAVKK